MTSKAKSTAKKKMSFFEKQKSVIIPILLLMALAMGTAYGVLLHKYELFPYKNLKATYRSLSNKKLVAHGRLVYMKAPRHST